MRTILVVEDDYAVAEGIRITLEAEAFNVETMSDAPGALDWLAHHNADLIIADIAMQGMNGYQLFQRVRDNPEWTWIPFIFLTAKTEVEDIRYGKEMGADDYLTKPIEPEDLVVAVRGRLTRYDQLKASIQLPLEKPSGQYQIGELLVHLSHRQVTVAGQDTKLSSTEFDVLQRLLLARGGVVLYRELLGYDQNGVMVDDKDAAQLLRYHMRSIRQKFKDAGVDSDIIVNVRSVGYRLAEEPLSLH